MNFILPTEILTLFSIFKKHHQELYLVGGSVRNYLLQEPIHDYDFASDANIYKMQNMFLSYPFSIQIHPTFQSITLKISEYKVEITQYRIEANYQNYRSPNSIIATKKFYMDILRRDFTCNTLAFHPDFGILDFLKARQQIRKRQLHCVKDANTTFRQDALRIYRALKLHIAYGFTISSSSYHAIKENVNNLNHLSIIYHADFLSFLVFCNCSYRFQLLHHYKILSLLFKQFHIQIPKNYSYAIALQLDQLFQYLTAKHSLSIAALLLYLYPYHQSSCSIVEFAKKVLMNLPITKKEKQYIYKLVKEYIFDIQQHSIYYAISIFDPNFLSDLLQLQSAFNPNNMILHLFIQQYEFIKKNHPYFLSTSICMQKKDLLAYKTSYLSLQNLFQKIHEFILIHPSKNTKKDILQWIQTHNT